MTNQGSSTLSPSSVAELAEAVRSAPRVIAVGVGTKPRLAQVAPEFVRISTARLSGIIDYEPSEFTFTALAGTPLREIANTLAARGQYLPFDPPLAEAGATLGGTVAAGLSGAGRFRFGGLRDFILGVRFVDGEGRLLRMGGKVVKNAAGFDLPKFFVGSLGRFGVLAEITFKVFPRATTLRTVRLPAGDAKAITEMLTGAAATRWELDALEASPDDGAVFARLAGPPAALDALAGEIMARWPGGAGLSEAEAEKIWRGASEFSWAHTGGVLLKVIVTPSRVIELAGILREIAGARSWLGAGGNVAWVSLPSAKATKIFGEKCRALRWPALTLRGEAPLWPGGRTNSAVASAVKLALDPLNRFPSLDE